MQFDLSTKIFQIQGSCTYDGCSGGGCSFGSCTGGNCQFTGSCGLKSCTFGPCVGGGCTNWGTGSSNIPETIHTSATIVWILVSLSFVSIISCVMCALFGSCCLRSRRRSPPAGFVSVSHITTANGVYVPPSSGSGTFMNGTPTQFGQTQGGTIVLNGPQQLYQPNLQPVPVPVPVPEPVGVAIATPTNMATPTAVAIQTPEVASAPQALESEAEAGSAQFVSGKDLAERL